MIYLRSGTVLFMLRLFENLFSIHFISSWDNQYPKLFRNEMFEEGDYDIIEVFDSVVFVEVVENLFSIHFNSS